MNPKKSGIWHFNQASIIFNRQTCLLSRWTLDLEWPPFDAPLTC